MPDDTKAPAPKATPAPAPTKSAAGGDAGEAEVQDRMDQEQEQGYSGVAVDETPNENYTVPGQAAGLPTPETEDDTEAEPKA